MCCTWFLDCCLGSASIAAPQVDCDEVIFVSCLDFPTAPADSVKAFNFLEPVHRITFGSVHLDILAIS